MSGHSGDGLVVGPGGLRGLTGSWVLRIGNGLKWCWGSSGWILGESHSLKELKCTRTGCPGSGGVAVPGGVKGT